MTGRPSGHQEKGNFLQEVESLWKADIGHQIKLLEPITLIWSISCGFPVSYKWIFTCQKQTVRAGEGILIQSGKVATIQIVQQEGQASHKIEKYFQFLGFSSSLQWSSE